MCGGLITNYDIKTHSLVFNRYISDCSVQTICAFEELLFLDCIGVDFYNELKNDVIDYSGAQLFSDEVNYSTGDVVIYKDVLYVSKVDNNDSNINDKEKWDFAPKFNSDCFNTVWCRYLVYILSAYSAIKTLQQKVVMVTDKGIVRENGSQFDKATLTEIDHQIRGLNSILNEYINSFKYYAMNYNDNGCFDTTLFLSNHCEVCKSIKCFCAKDKCKDKFIKNNYWDVG